MAVSCPQCGSDNTDAAKFCSNCGSQLPAAAESPSATTATYRIGETGELIPVELDEVVVAQGAALVIRSGGGRVGESFPLDRDRMAIGRRPDTDVFLDDVTVSRDHALLVKRGGVYHLDDLGSLNGTYVNRKRIESQRLDDNDELQIGKFKLTFLAR